MQCVKPCSWQKREGGEKKTVYLLTTVKKQKKHQTLTQVSWQPVSLT